MVVAELLDITGLDSAFGVVVKKKDDAVLLLALV
jgi:hypothetical protein